MSGQSEALDHATDAIYLPDFESADATYPGDAYNGDQPVKISQVIDHNEYQDLKDSIIKINRAMADNDPQSPAALEGILSILRLFLARVPRKDFINDESLLKEIRELAILSRIPLIQQTLSGYFLALRDKYKVASGGIDFAAYENALDHMGVREVVNVIERAVEILKDENSSREARVLNKRLDKSEWRFTYSNTVKELPDDLNSIIYGQTA